MSDTEFDRYTLAKIVAIHRAQNGTGEANRDPEKRNDYTPPDWEGIDPDRGAGGDWKQLRSHLKDVTKKAKDKRAKLVRKT